MDPNFRSGFCAIIGRPNVGKSTLLNRIVGRKVAITSDKPQTTRHRIAGVLHRADGQIVFLDTPGIHRPKHRLGEYMVHVAERALEGVDAVLFLVEAASPVPGAGDRRIAHYLERVSAPVFLAVNKIDAVPREAVPDILAAYGSLGSFTAVHGISALQGDGVDQLVADLMARMPPGPPYFPADVITDRPEEFLLAELIREQIFHLTREEIPHAVTVQVDELKQRPNGVVYLAATIYVERESQKGILIGEGGRMLKEVGSRARAEIEALFGSPFYLDLHVKVKEGWRDRPGSLQSLGYRLD